MSAASSTGPEDDNVVLPPRRNVSLVRGEVVRNGGEYLCDITRLAITLQRDNGPRRPQV